MGAKPVRLSGVRCAHQLRAEQAVILAFGGLFNFYDGLAKLHDANDPAADGGCREGSGGGGGTMCGEAPSE